MASRQQLKKWDVCTGGKDAGVSECVSQARGEGRMGRTMSHASLKMSVIWVRKYSSEGLGVSLYVSPCLIASHTCMYAYTHSHALTLTHTRMHP